MDGGPTSFSERRVNDHPQKLIKDPQVRLGLSTPKCRSHIIERSQNTLEFELVVNILAGEWHISVVIVFNNSGTVANARQTNRWCYCAQQTNVSLVLGTDACI